MKTSLGAVQWLLINLKIISARDNQECLQSDSTEKLVFRIFENQKNMYFNQMDYVYQEREGKVFFII